MINSYFIPIKIFQATALSDLVNRYPLRQLGSDVGRIGVDSALLTDDSTDSLLYKFL